jgi:tetratricopeptide (TPR) repeat protein
MKALFFFLLMLTTVSTFADNASRYKVTELRGQYLEASKSSEAAKRFNKMMGAYKDHHPVIMAYKAASEATMAKHVWNPYTKLHYLQRAAKLFEEAVKLDGQNPEIRFLRFTVEHYIPRYLNMSGNLQEDKQIIINSLKSYPSSGISADWARTMQNFLLSKDHCTEEEKKTLRSINV